ncbi:MAG: DUF1015 family protein [Acidimicrobiia bacterium]|nr:DUF1015 family protein [Acidimicrobiia bacterium]
MIEPAWTDRVPSPAHDALTPAQRIAHLRDNPDSYLGVTRGPEDDDGSEPLSARELVSRGRISLDTLLEAGAFSDVREDRFYAYRLALDGWSQTGIVGGVHLDDYESGTIRIHEAIQPERASHLALHSEIVGAQSSPIAVAHHPRREIAQVVEQVDELEPDLSFSMPDGLDQTVWSLPESDNNVIREGLEDARLYLIDGHHRAAAAAIRHGQGGSPWVLAALFSTDQLQNRAFHRFAQTSLADPLAELMRIDGAENGRIGDGIGTLQVYFDTDWITVPHQRAQRPLERLDTWQFEQLIRPRLGPDAVVRFQKAHGDEEALLRMVDESGELLVLMTAVTMPQLFAVADAGDVMPPKSTYFEPNVRSGIFLRHL